MILPWAASAQPVETPNRASATAAHPPSATWPSLEDQDRRMEVERVAILEEAGRIRSPRGRFEAGLAAADFLSRGSFPEFRPAAVLAMKALLEALRQGESEGQGREVDANRVEGEFGRLLALTRITDSALHEELKTQAEQYLEESGRRARANLHREPVDASSGSKAAAAALEEKEERKIKKIERSRVWDRDFMAPPFQYDRNAVRSAKTPQEQDEKLLTLVNMIAGFGSGLEQVKSGHSFDWIQLASAESSAIRSPEIYLKAQVGIVSAYLRAFQNTKGVGATEARLRMSNQCDATVHQASTMLDERGRAETYLQIGGLTAAADRSGSDPVSLVEAQIRQRWQSYYALAAREALRVRDPASRFDLLHRLTELWATYAFWNREPAKFELTRLLAADAIDAYVECRGLGRSDCGSLDQMVESLGYLGSLNLAFPGFLLDRVPDPVERVQLRAKMLDVVRLFLGFAHEAQDAADEVEAKKEEEEAGPRGN